MGLGAANLTNGLTVIIPTFQERENMSALMDRLGLVAQSWDRKLEVLVVDDNSSDGTASAAASLGAARGLAVRVLRRQGPRNVTRAIGEGIAMADGDLVCVMDADLSHPPEYLPRLMAALDGADGVVGSRYVTGARIDHWPRWRRTISLTATALARAVVNPPVRDPLSGFFLFRKDAISDLPISGHGTKPLLEILAQRRLAVREVPYEFHDRMYGQSKLRFGDIVGYLSLLIRLRKKGFHGKRGPTETDSERS